GADHDALDPRHRLRDARVLLLDLREAGLASPVAGRPRADRADALLRPPGHRVHGARRQLVGHARAAPELSPMVEILGVERRADRRVRWPGLRLAGDQGAVEGLVFLGRRAPLTRR